MSLSSESIEVGRCYLTIKGEVRRVLAIEADKVAYHTILKSGFRQSLPRYRVNALRTFAATVEREVPCDWTPETDD
jgi:hypothetical protein